jgi:hypothetical protein
MNVVGLSTDGGGQDGVNLKCLLRKGSISTWFNTNMCYFLI